MINQLNIDLPRFSVLTPFPGTPAYNMLQEQGRINESNWSLYDGQHVVFQPEQMSSEELQEGLYWSWKNTYKLSSIFNRIYKSRSNFLLSAMANVGYKYYSKKLPEYNKNIVMDLEPANEVI